MVNRDADERREQNTREPIVKRGSGSHPVASPWYFVSDLFTDEEKVARIIAETTRVPPHPDDSAAAPY